MSDLGQIEQRVATLERELAELKARPPRRRLGNPWKRMQGMLANEPMFDEWVQAIQEYRQQQDQLDALDEPE